MPVRLMHTKLSRRSLLVAAATAGPVAAMGRRVSGASAERRVSFDLQTATIAEINAAFDAGALNAQALLRLYFDRIEAFNSAGPAINAFITLNSRAREIARLLDREREQRGPRSPLHGIPIVFKDLFNTEDMPTSGGFSGLATSFSGRDATVVRRLRAAGAIVLGKTNLSDWFGRPAAGDQSTRAGRTRNPYNLSLTPGGSSGGSAAAVAAAFAQASLGTETGISVRNPASNNGLVALVATRGAVSRAGVLMASFLQDRPGVMARSVYDVAVLADCLLGFDPEDLATESVLGRLSTQSFAIEPDPASPINARIGVLRDLFRSGAAHEEASSMVLEAIQALRNAGATIVDPVSTGLDLLAALPDARTTRFESRYAHDLYFRQLGPRGAAHSIDEFIEKFAAELDPSVLQAVRPDLSRNRDLLAAQRKQREIRNAVARAMDMNRLDALIYPFKTLPATNPLMKDGSELDADHDNALSAITGLPAIVFPVGVTRAENAPIALELLGRELAEPALFRIAFGCERALPKRIRPALTPALAGERFIFEQKRPPIPR